MSHQPHTYAIIGSGALGAYYGARLMHGGAEVHFLMHSDYTHVATQGLVVESSQHGDLTLPRVRAYPSVADMPRCDVVVVGLKTTSNTLLPKLLPHIVKDDGCVLTLQNGLGPEDAAASAVGAERVLGGLCFLCSNKVGPGHIRQTYTDRVKFGEFMGGGISDRMRRIDADLMRGSVETDMTEDLLAARWEKLVWNAAYNGLCAVKGVDAVALMHDPQGAAQARYLMEEVAAAAQATAGHTIPDSFIERMLSRTMSMDAYKPSMMIDREMGRPMEIEAIYGEPIRRAEATGLKLPRMRELYQQLKQLGS